MTRSRKPVELAEDLGSSMRTGKTWKKTLGIDLSHLHLVTHSYKHKNGVLFGQDVCGFLANIILSLKLILEHESFQNQKQRNLWAF